MKVYVAWYFGEVDESDSHLVGVYYSKDKAKQAIEKDQHRGHGLYYYSDCYEIEEFEVE